jgi:hypothetical protein
MVVETMTNIWMVMVLEYVTPAKEPVVAYFNWFLKY